MGWWRNQGQISPFLISLSGRPYNTLLLPCKCVILTLLIVQSIVDEQIGYLSRVVLNSVAEMTVAAAGQTAHEAEICGVKRFVQRLNQCKQTCDGRGGRALSRLVTATRHTV